ncbi:hypothetical protein BH10BAC3_BH10BAC3_19530 [soil metagenome]
MIKHYSRLLFLFLLLFRCFISSFAQTEADWQSLFNERNLKGWDVKIAGHRVGDNYNNTFGVKDSMLRVSYENYETFGDNFGHLFYKNPFSYYILRFQYRFTGEQAKGGPDWGVRSGGVLLHAQSAKSMTINQDYPFSLELQLLGGVGKGERRTANACTNGTRVQMNGKLSMAHCVSSTSKTYNGDQWVQVSVMVLGDSLVSHIVEGDTVISYEKPIIGAGMVNKELHVDNPAYWIEQEGKPLGEGYIAIQAKSQPIDFKNIQILNLKGCTDPKAKNYKAYYLKSDNAQCRY